MRWTSLGALVVSLLAAASGHATSFEILNQSVEPCGSDRLCLSVDWSWTGTGFTPVGQASLDLPVPDPALWTLHEGRVGLFTAGGHAGVFDISYRAQYLGLASYFRHSVLGTDGSILASTNLGVLVAQCNHRPYTESTVLCGDSNIGGHSIRSVGAADAAAFAGPLTVRYEFTQLWALPPQSELFFLEDTNGYVDLVYEHAIPEPGGTALFTLGLAVLGIVYKRAT